MAINIELHSLEMWNQVWSNKESNISYAYTPSRFARANDKIGYWLQRGIEFKKNEKVLEAGCGDGMIILQLMKYFDVQGFGTDFSHEALMHAQNMCFHEKLYPQLDCADIRRMNYEDSTFDKVISLGVVEHMQDMQPSFDELYRVLKPGGLLILMTPNRRSAVRLSRHWRMLLGKWTLGYQDEYTPEQLTEFALRSGFNVLDRDVINRRKMPHETKHLRFIRRVDHFLSLFLPRWGFYSYIFATKN